uniref:Uncharacterized protein n=1 Tax=Panagrolaimus davidi TaxID=227884 RepID=A0A914Q788_9BILA
MDAFVLIDAIIAILCEPHSRFHACAIYTLLRMVQTSRSFASTSEEALNIPLFHFLVQEISQLCTHPEPCHRLGGIYLLEIIIENFPTNFLFAAFETLITAALDALHFGDDDISQTSQESSMEVGKKLIDKVFEQKSEDLYKYLAAVVLKHSKSCSFWTNKLLCEILIYLQAQTIVSPLELFSASDVQEFYKQHEIEFMNSKMEFCYVQLNLLTHLLNCSPHLLHFSSHTSDYLQQLAGCFLHSDEVISNSPNYETVPPHPPNGTNLVPSSPLFKPYGAPFFMERIKHFRTIVAGATAALCLNFYKSQNLTAIHITSNFAIQDISSAEEAAKFLLRLHATTILKQTDPRFDLSVVVLAELGSHMVFNNKTTFISEIISLLLSEPKRTYLYKALDALIKHKTDLLHRQLSSLIISTNPQYFSLCQSLTKILQPNEGMVEHLLALLNVCRKIEYKDDALFNDLFSMLSSKRILAMFELGEIDLFSPAVIFLGSDPECSMKANNFFLSPVNLKDELKRKAYLTLICHPDGQHFLTSIKHCQQILIDLIKLRVLKSGNFERAAEIEPMTLDEFVFKILTKFASTFPNWFARNKKLAEFLRQFLLSDYFRGNYLLQDFCIGKNDRLRLTNFRLALANVPDLVTNLLINYFTYNPKKYEILLALCSLLPQMTFADNGSLKRFISNFIVPVSFKIRHKLRNNKKIL